MGGKPETGVIVTLTTSELMAPPAFLEEERTCLSPDFQKTFHSRFPCSRPDPAPAPLPCSGAPCLLHLHPPSLGLCWVLPIGGTYQVSCILARFP